MAITIIEDTAQQNKKHTLKHMYFEQNSVQWCRYPLPVGDYILADERVLDVIGRKTRRGIQVKKMDFMGAYKVCVDTKQDMQEIVGNLCGAQHERFRDECILAQQNGIKLYVLIENRDKLECLNDVAKWVNPRSRIIKWTRTPDGRSTRSQAYPHATKGSTLYKTMRTMEAKYGVTFLFCEPEDAGEQVVRLLLGGAQSGK